MNDLEITDELGPGADAAPAEAGFGALETARGHLPLAAMDVRARVEGLDAHTAVSQTYRNVFDEPLEATYIFPLPDRAAVTRFRLEVAGRVVEGQLKERGAARADYDAAISAGKRAAIAEEERPGVFTIRAGNIPPGETVKVSLEVTGPLPVADGEATYRFPLVVAPRYIPGVPLDGPPVGDGVAADTDLVPDASRISPPVLLPGQPNPVRLGLEVAVAPGVATGPLKAALHELEAVPDGDGGRLVRLRPGTERLNRDFVLRIPVAGDELVSRLTTRPDPDHDGEGTFALTVMPPGLEASGTPPRDVVVVLDRSGSMGGWKMVAARRAAGRLIDTLTHHDRFGLVLFDNRIEEFRPDAAAAAALLPASDRNRFRAVEFLAKVEARGGTEMGPALEAALARFDEDAPGRRRVVVFVTDGQVGDEDGLLWRVRRRGPGVRIHAIGIDRAVNESFLRRLAGPTGGASEVVESEDRLDAVMRAMYRRVGAPLVTGLEVDDFPGLDRDSLSPGGVRDVFPGVPARIYGRYRGGAPDAVTVRGRRAGGGEFSAEVPGRVAPDAPLAAAWARARLLDLEHEYVTGGKHDAGLAADITALSLRFGVLCRFTSFVAVDPAVSVEAGGELHRITQPVESVDGWGRAAPTLAGGGGGYKLYEALDEEFCEGGPMPATLGGAAPGAGLLDLGADLDGGGAAFDLGPPPPAAPPPPSPARPAPAPRPSKKSRAQFSPPPEEKGNMVAKMASMIGGARRKLRRGAAGGAGGGSAWAAHRDRIRALAPAVEAAFADLAAPAEPAKATATLGALLWDLRDLLERVREADPAAAAQVDEAAALLADAETVYRDRPPAGDPRWRAAREALGRMVARLAEWAEAPPARARSFWR